ncbi:hypothetical protein [Blastococcus sp. TF02A-26]|uniref:hypothetical protein n=1 Tax=Blastococcus sp. TF02A-26 TaxID=2250577 RepID=UPI0011BE53BF|nr:hypothetical protein [Blastococcus sp. TF02A-26]
MHATIRAVDVAATAATTGDGDPLGTVVLASSDGPGGTRLDLWPDAASAARTGADRVYRVTDVMHGLAAGRRPLFAQVTWINGDGDPARADAAEYAGRHRIRPAVHGIEGVVEVLVLRSDDHRVVVVGLATGRETHQEVQRTIMATALLPDEDPALLTGADRIDLVRVLSAELPTAVRS